MLTSSVIENPYSPPAEESLPGVPAAAQVQWFSPVQVGICTFFGGPLAGTALLWLNTRQARWQRQTEIFLGLLVLVAVLTLALAVPNKNSYGYAFLSAGSLNLLAKLQLATYLRDQPRPLPRRGWILLGVVLGAFTATLLAFALVGGALALIGSGLVSR